MLSTHSKINSKKNLQLSRKKLRDNKRKRMNSYLNSYLNSYVEETEKKEEEQNDFNFTELPPDLLKIVIEYAEISPSYFPMNEHNFKDISEIYEEMFHDGYDKYGPESNIYNTYILLNISGVKYMCVWTREDWYYGSEREKNYYFDGYKDFNTYMKEIKESHSMRNVVAIFKKHLHKRLRIKNTTF